MVNTALADLGSLDYTLFFTGTGNIRNEFYPIYKANRAGKEKPRHLEFLKDWVFKTYPPDVVVQEDMLEADDLIADAQETDGTIIVSLDKDLKQLVGWNWNFAKKELEYINEDSAVTLIMKQLLTGDTVDNIPRICKSLGFGLGKVTVNNLLDGLDPYQQIAVVHDIYVEAYGCDDWKLAFMTNLYLLKVGTHGRGEMEYILRELN